jgi:hypothetical protein
MAKAQPKVYTVVKTRDRGDRPGLEFTGTVSELVEKFSYTLECGQSWQHEKGNKKINRNPKTIDGLITNLNNAVNNTAANGYAGVSYALA